MSEWTACCFGEIALPGNAAHAWRARIADAAAYRDWPYPEALPEAALSVTELLRELEQLGRRGNHVVITETADGVTLRALFTGETTLWCQTIALAVREAAAVGARGMLTFVDATEPRPAGPLEGQVLRLELGEGRSRFRALRGKDAAAVRGDPHAIETVMEVLGDSIARPERPRTARWRASEAAAERGQAVGVAAAEKRGALSPTGAMSALRKAVRAGVKTSASAQSARGFVEKIVADPGDEGERTLRDAWRTLLARAPRLNKGGTSLDPEMQLRLAVGKAVLRLGTRRVANVSVRARLRLPTRKEWPNERQLREAVTELLKLDR